MKVITIDEYRNIQNLMEGNSIYISWDNINGNKNYNIEILKESVEKFNVNDTVLFNLLNFYGFNSFYHKDSNSTIIKMPKLWYKNKELSALMKELNLSNLMFQHGKTIFGIDKINGIGCVEYYNGIQDKIRKIMRIQYENMKTLYYAHPMKTYNMSIEKEGLNIIEREIGNKLPSSIKEVVNPNSDKYRWKGERDMHETEDWGSGFSWEGFANSMPHYCNLVYNSDGVIYLPIFDFNRRKNARRKFTRKIKRGMKTEMSYCTKLGDPLITFTDPDNNMLPTDIELPYYMLDNIRGRVTVPAYSTNNERIVDRTNNNEIGMIEGNIIKDINNKTIAKIVKFAYVNCEKCGIKVSVPISGANDESELIKFCDDPHKGCEGKISFHISEYESIVDMKDNIVGNVNIEVDFTTNPRMATRYISYRTFKGNPYSNYNKEENSRRYNSPYPFHMYINKETNEIHEKPEDAGSIGGDVIPFEPWSI